MSETVDLSPAFVTLWKECFEGIPEGASGTWFVERTEGLLDALQSVTSERASCAPSPRCPTIAAHGFHLLFALQGLNGYLGRAKPEGTWESSWERQEVTDVEWRKLAADVAEEYRYFLNWIESGPDWGDDPANRTGALAILPHMAYHLGAVRTLMRIV